MIRYCKCASLCLTPCLLQEGYVYSKSHTPFATCCFSFRSFQFVYLIDRVCRGREESVIEGLWECTGQLIVSSTECKDALPECDVLFPPGNCGTRS